ncbi:hypothetical protein BJ912DRAFT_985719 [Pholiota molesta]|nr:hypothetical protein BJ912DRAFT_985719 [Pholiota molesta]
MPASDSILQASQLSSSGLHNSPTAAASMPVDSSMLHAQTAQFIDNLMERFHLSVAQRDDLYGLYQLGISLDNPLGRADIMTRIYFLACQYGIEQRQLQVSAPMSTESSNGGTGPGELKGLIKELKVRLDDTFQITKDQRTHIRLLCQELISKPSRTSYKNLHLDVEKKMRSKPDAYKMSNIFGQITREQKWASEARRIASNIRNVFRQEIHDSIIGKRKCSLQEFTSDRLVRYRLGGSSNTEQGHLIRNVILRRFAWENRLSLGNEEDSENEASSSDLSSEASKKRKRGRIAHGEDFWSKVDAWFKEKIALWGSDFTGPDWKTYVDESIELDNIRFTPRQQIQSDEFTSPSPSLSSHSLSNSATSHSDSTDGFVPSTPAWLGPPSGHIGQTLHDRAMPSSSSLVNNFLQNIGCSS